MHLSAHPTPTIAHVPDLTEEFSVCNSGALTALPIRVFAGRKTPAQYVFNGRNSMESTVYPNTTAPTNIITTRKSCQVSRQLVPPHQQLAEIIYL
jgi:hypothetical protein